MVPRPGHRLLADDAPDAGDLVAPVPRGRRLGDRRPGDVGVRDRQLRLVDRHRPRRYADLGDPAAAQAGLADVDQPVRRGDDPLRRGLRRAVPAVAPGPALGLLLAAAVSQHDGPLAAVAQPAHLGRLRRLDLRHGVAAVLVRRPDPRPGHAEGPGEEPLGALYLRHPGDGLARLGAALASLPQGVPAPGRPGDPAGRLGPLGRGPRLHRGASCPAGTRRSSRRSSSPGRSSPASPWS